MARMIADNLNYDDPDIYVEPFGGACRVLLNKPRHKLEIYNDYGDGLTTIIRILADPELSRELIYRLHETEYSQEQFEWAKDIYDATELDLTEYISNTLMKELKDLLVHYKLIPQKSNVREFKAALDDEDIKRRFANAINNEPEPKRNRILSRLENLEGDYSLAKEVGQKYGPVERARDSGMDISDMDLAMATYIVFTQSRDAMGKVWSSSKFKSTDQYRKRISNLYECAERLKHVEVYTINAMEFVRWYAGVDRDNNIKYVNEGYAQMLGWIHEPKVMMYCDPSYIDPREEEKALEDIDWKNAENLSQEIKENKNPSDLGHIYTMSFDYEDHENFLKCIYDAKCKIMVSNYDLKLYNKYLTPNYGWKRLEFDTTTSVGGKADNRRREILWYNY